MSGIIFGIVVIAVSYLYWDRFKAKKQQRESASE